MKISKTVKIAAVILILCAGLIGSYFIVQNSISTAEVKEKTVRKESEPIAQNPIQWIKENIGDVLSKIDELNQLDLSENSNLLVSASQPEKNLTVGFSEIIFEQIKLKNEQGLTEKDGQTAISAANEEVIYQELLNGFLSNNPSDSPYHPKVDEKKIKTSQDISPDNQIQYVKNLESISQKNFAGFDKTSNDVLGEIIEKKDFSSAVQLAEIYGKITGDSQQVSVPKNWIDFHKAFLSHFYSAQSMWQSIADFQNDPLKAYLAQQFIDDLEDSAKGLQVLLARGISENNLNF